MSEGLIAWLSEQMGDRPQVLGEGGEVEGGQQDAVHAVAEPYAQPVAGSRHRVQLPHHVPHYLHRVRAHPTTTQKGISLDTLPHFFFRTGDRSCSARSGQQDTDHRIKSGSQGKERKRWGAPHLKSSSMKR